MGEEADDAEKGRRAYRVDNAQKRGQRETLAVHMHLAVQLQ